MHSVFKVSEKNIVFLGRGNCIQFLKFQKIIGKKCSSPNIDKVHSKIPILFISSQNKKLNTIVYGHVNMNAMTQVSAQSSCVIMLCSEFSLIPLKNCLWQVKYSSPTARGPKNSWRFGCRLEHPVRGDPPTVAKLGKLYGE